MAALAMLFVALLAPASRADVIPSGHKSVDHRIVLEGDAADYRLVAAPTAGFGVREVKIGEAFRFSSKYGTRLWAFPKDSEIPERWEKERFEKAARMARLPSEVATVPLMNPLRSIRTHLRIEGLAQGELRLVRVQEIRDPENPERVMILRVLWIALAIVGLIALFVLRKRWRRRPVRNETPESH